MAGERSLLSSTDSGRNPGNSQNSGGIKFGRGACQIDSMILTEFRMEFKFRWNGSWNHMEGINSWNSTEWNLVPLPQHEQCPATPKLIVSVGRRSIWVWSTTPNPTLSQPPSLTQLVTVTRAHHHPTSSPVALNNHCTSQHSKNKTRTPFPLKNNATMPYHQLNKCPPGATLLTATWQPDDEQHCLLSSFTFS